MITTAIGQVQSGAGSAASATAGQSSTVSYDAFLKLLIATMKNQDPTAPNDPAQSLSQLASFSMVEQGIKTNSKLDALIGRAAAGEAGSLIGKHIETADGAIKDIINLVEITSDGLVAVTAAGHRIPIAAGVKISAP